MDGGTAVAVTGGGPAPFLLKTYDMVDDSATDDIVSWSPSRKSFIVWNPPEFARLLLPTYFKHNNFSSFIRQLNTYIPGMGFRKIDPERWEFANEDFVKDQKHLLKNIHRRKPIHSHSNPQGTTIDSERAAFEEEIDKLSREKTILEGSVVRFKQQQSAAKVQLEDLTQRITGMEHRQENLLSYLDKAVQNPSFVERLAQKLESMDVSAYNKKRRLPQVAHSHSVQENALVDNHSSSKPEFGNIFHQDFCNKLRLELSPAVSDINLLSHSTQSSNEEGESPQLRISEGWPKDVHKSGGTVFAPETLELSDTGTSFGLKKMDSSVPHKMGCTESPNLHSLQTCLTSNEEGDGIISCHLNLSLASSSLPVVKSQHSTEMVEMAQEIDKCVDTFSKEGLYITGSKADGNEAYLSIPPENKDLPNDDATVSSSQRNKQGPATGQTRVNDVFWEQFLTERPGSSETEEASSSLRACQHEDQEERKFGQGMARNVKIAEHLTL